MRLRTPNELQHRNTPRTKFIEHGLQGHVAVHGGAIEDGCGSIGSDDHGQAAGNLLSLIASARLHQLDPEAYLRNLFRVLPHWPRDRYLELAPKYWRTTRARLDAAQLERELGPLTVPDPAPSSEQPAAH
jgi:hypothetical protein